MNQFMRWFTIDANMRSQMKDAVSKNKILDLSFFLSLFLFFRHALLRCSLSFILLNLLTCFIFIPCHFPQLLATLSSPLLSAGKAASQAVAAVAEAEMPQGQWDALIPYLKNNVSSADSNTRECTLQTIGYVCETIVSIYFSLFFLL